MRRSQRRSQSTKVGPDLQVGSDTLLLGASDVADARRGRGGQVRLLVSGDLIPPVLPSGPIRPVAGDHAAVHGHRRATAGGHQREQRRENNSQHEGLVSATPGGGWMSRTRSAPARAQVASRWSRDSRYAASRVSGNEITKKTTATAPKISNAWFSPRPIGGAAMSRSFERFPDSSSSFAPMTAAIVVFWMMFTSRLTSGGSRRRSAR